MARSGSYNYKLNRNEVFTEMLDIIGEYSPGESLSNNDIDTCSKSLNPMIKSWQSRDYGLWLIKEVELILQNDTISYNLGPTGTHCSLTSDLVKTELAADAASAATSFTIDSTTGMSDNFDRDGIYTAGTPSASGAITLAGALVSGSVATLTSQRKILIYSDGNDSGITFAIVGTDNLGVSVSESITGPNATTVYSTEEYATVTSITVSGAGTGNIEVGQVGDHVGIELDSGSMQWTNLGSALSTTITPITALSGAAGTDNHVYVYTSKIQRPLDIVECRRRNADDGDIPIWIISRTDYMDLSNKTNEGPVNSVWYDPQLDNGVLTTWLETDSVKDRLRMSVKYPVQDLDSSTDDFDFPQEWLDALIWNGAVRIAPKFGRSVTQDVRIMAIQTLEEAKRWDREHVDIVAKPNLRGYRR